MAEIKQKAGKMACETCGEPVVVKTNERGTLSYNCQECDAAPYARAGTGQNAAWRRKMTGQAAPEAAPAAKPAPAPAPAAKKPAATFFD